MLNYLNLNSREARTRILLKPYSKSSVYKIVGIFSYVGTANPFNMRTRISIYRYLVRGLVHEC